MYCMKCGAELPENAEFCPLCGTKVKYKTVPRPTAPGGSNRVQETPSNKSSKVNSVAPYNAAEGFSTSPQNTQPDSSTSPQNTQPSSSAPSPSKKSSLLPIIAAIVACLAILIGAGTFFLLRQNADEESVSANKNPETAAQTSSASAGQTTENKKSSEAVTPKKKAAKNENKSKFHLIETWEYELDASYASTVSENEYDDAWHLISVTENGTPKKKYEYDAYGNCIAEYTYKNGVLVEGVKFEYDETGTYNVRMNYVNSADELVGYGENEYDDQGRIIRYSGYRMDGRLGEYNEYNYNSDGSYSMTEHLALLVSEKTISHNYNANGDEYRCETTYANVDQRELEEKTWSDDGKVLSIIKSNYSAGYVYYEETRTNEFNDQGYFCHASCNVRELNGDRTGYNESAYNIYQEYDRYGNKIHYLNEKSGKENYYVYVNEAGQRFGDDFDHRGVSE